MYLPKIPESSLILSIFFLLSENRATSDPEKIAEQKSRNKRTITLLSQPISKYNY